jgi:hypothetical protein
MVRSAVAAEASLAADAAGKQAAQQQGVPHTRPADLPVYGQQFMRVEAVPGST